MATHTNQYIREVLHSSNAETPPPIRVRYFYTSPLVIDDPLSPLPPPVTGATSVRRRPPRPFSEYDNEMINSTWLGLRKKILKHNEEFGEKQKPFDIPGTPTNPVVERLRRNRGESASGEETFRTTMGRDIPSTRSASGGQYSKSSDSMGDDHQGSSCGSQSAKPPTSLCVLDPADASPLQGSTTTGTPFIRAPERGNMAQIRTPASVEGRKRPRTHELDSYNWDEDMESTLFGKKDKGQTRRYSKSKMGPSAKVPVGVSRLHHVVMEANSIRMEPIYWSPVNDISKVIRGTWFYKDTMMPVEVEVANMLEVGYLEMQPWSQTWADELNSAVEVGALGEMKILHRLWPEKSKRLESRPTSSNEMRVGLVQNTLSDGIEDPEKERREIVENAADLIDISTGLDGSDNKAAGDTEYSHNGRKNLYLQAGVIYASEKEAYLLKPALQPSNYYGRRPLANYIRKGRPIGLCVTRGFDQHLWDKFHPNSKSPVAVKANECVSTAQSGTSTFGRQRFDQPLALSERSQVTDLVLVVHGIGQKLSERMETFHFTHAINSFRREVNVELGSPEVKRHLRADMGGIMVLPVCLLNFLKVLIISYFSTTFLLPILYFTPHLERMTSSVKILPPDT